MILIRRGVYRGEDAVDRQRLQSEERRRRIVLREKETRHRLAVCLWNLRKGTGVETTVNELAEPFDMTLPAVSKHLKVLEHAGLISRGHQAQFRPCALETARLQEVLTWAEQYRPIWDSRFDQMDAYISQMQTPRGTKGNDDKRQ